MRLEVHPYSRPCTPLLEGRLSYERHGLAYGIHPSMVPAAETGEGESCHRLVTLIVYDQEAVLSPSEPESPQGPYQWQSPDFCLLSKKARCLPSSGRRGP